MTDQRSRQSFPVPPSAFKGFRFPPEVIVLAVRWYLRFGLSYRDVEELFAERYRDDNWKTLHYDYLVQNQNRLRKSVGNFELLEGAVTKKQQPTGPNPKTDNARPTGLNYIPSRHPWWPVQAQRDKA